MNESRLAYIFKSIINGEGTWVEKLDAIIKLKKDEEGLIGVSLSVFPKDGEDVDNESVAKGLCMMILSDAEGKFKDITGEKL